MEALNDKERTTAFWKFILALVFVLFLVIVATLSAVEVNDTENMALKQQNEDLRRQIPPMDEVMPLMNDIQNNMDAYRKESVQAQSVEAVQLKSKITNGIAKLSKNDSTDFARVENKMATAYTFWLDDISKFKSTTGMGQNVVDLQKKLADCKQDNADMLQSFNAYKLMHP